LICLDTQSTPLILSLAAIFTQARCVFYSGLQWFECELKHFSFIFSIGFASLADTDFSLWSSLLGGLRLRL